MAEWPITIVDPDRNWVELEREDLEFQLAKLGLHIVTSDDKKVLDLMSKRPQRELEKQSWGHVGPERDLAEAELARRNSTKA